MRLPQLTSTPRDNSGTNSFAIPNGRRALPEYDTQSLSNPNRKSAKLGRNRRRSMAVKLEPLRWEIDI